MGLKHIARITKSNLDEMLDDRRVQLIASYNGIIQLVTPENAIFGFPSTLLKVGTQPEQRAQQTSDGCQ